MKDERIEAAITACLDCAQACLRCEGSCGAHPLFTACKRSCRDCFDACVLCLADLRDDPRRAAASCLACAIACEHCAVECDRYFGERFRRCVVACRICAALCREIAAGGAPGYIAGDFNLAIDGVRWSAIGVRDRGMPGD
jgi:hypothetical protein